MALAGRRRGAGMTQIELAAIVGVSVTTVGHAETGRLWQSRNFWERADKALGAHGLLLRHHDDYRAAARPQRVRFRSRIQRIPSPQTPPDPAPAGCDMHNHHVGRWNDNHRAPARPHRRGPHRDIRDSWDVPRRYATSVNVPQRVG